MTCLWLWLADRCVPRDALCWRRWWTLELDGLFTDAEFDRLGDWIAEATFRVTTDAVIGGRLACWHGDDT